MRRYSSESSSSVEKDPIINQVRNKNNEIREKKEVNKEDLPNPIGVLTIKSYRHFVDLFYQKKRRNVAYLLIQQCQTCFF